MAGEEDGIKIESREDRQQAQSSSGSRPSSHEVPGFVAPGDLLRPHAPPEPIRSSGKQVMTPLDQEQIEGLVSASVLVNEDKSRTL